MKESTFKVTFKVILILFLAVGLPQLSLTQELTQYQSQPIWGAVSNGICAGVDIRRAVDDLNKEDFCCNLEVGNMSTNRVWVWLPPLEHRYEIELRGPDGQRIRQVKPLVFAQKHPMGLAPLSKNGSLDWCFLKDTFDVRTNGLHTLIVSVRVNVFTNFAVGRMQMQAKPDYFLLPPVTNTFNILPSMPDGSQSRSL